MSETETERDALIELIEKALPTDPDLGTAWAFLRAGCEYWLNGRHLTIVHATFDTFESGEPEGTSEYILPRTENETNSVRPTPKCVTPPGVRTDYSRDELLDICRRAIVPADKWLNRDTPDAQEKVGECFARLLRGDTFAVVEQGDHFTTDEQTIWLDIEGETFYLPTERRLEEANGTDWY